MQISNLDNTHNHNMHHVTSCMHDHEEASAKLGGMKVETSQQRTQTNALEAVAEGQLSLLDMARKYVLGGSKLFSKVWGDSKGVDTSVITQKEDKLPAQQTVLTQNNPYFTAVADRGTASPTIPTIREKIRVRLHTLAKRFGGGFLAKQYTAQNSTQTNRQRANGQRPKENLRRQSRYRKDGLEIECILTDDSYLMDSYDRNGEYSTLSATK